MNGRRIKIYHKGIIKLCKNCFGKHQKSECKMKEKVEWLNYVKNFVREHPAVQNEFYNR